MPMVANTANDMTALPAVLMGSSLLSDSCKEQSAEVAVRVPSKALTLILHPCHVVRRGPFFAINGLPWRNSQGAVLRALREAAVVGEGECDAGADALFAGNAESQSQALAHESDEVEAHSRGRTALAPVASRESTVEHAREIRGADPAAIVCYLDDGATVWRMGFLFSGRERDGVRIILRCVRDDLAEHEYEPWFIGEDFSIFWDLDGWDGLLLDEEARLPFARFADGCCKEDAADGVILLKCG